MSVRSETSASSLNDSLVTSKFFAIHLYGMFQDPCPPLVSESPDLDFTLRIQNFHWGIADRNILEDFDTICQQG